MTIRSKKQLIEQLICVKFEKLEESRQREIIEYIINAHDTVFKTTEFRQSVVNTLKTWSKELSDPKMIEKILDFILKLTIRDARENFYTFVKLCAPEVIPNKYKDGRHIKIISEELQRLYDSYAAYQDTGIPADRSQVFLSPRSMKSVMCSIMFPAWILGRNPSYRILLVGNNTQNAIDNFGRPLRNFLQNDLYNEIFPDTILDPQASAAQRFFTTKGGGYFCSGANVQIAGRGGDFIICDDIMGEQTAMSKIERTKINGNYLLGIRSRAQPGAAELIVNTRYHLEDISGYTLKIDKDSKRPWRVISIPAILDEESAELMRRPGDPEDWYKPGTTYWPEYKPLEQLEELRETYMKTEPHKWHALYMQRPTPEDGNIVKHTDWKWWPSNRDLPEISTVIVSMDTAFSEKERADYSAYTVWGVFYNQVQTTHGVQEIPCMVMLHAERGKWDFYELCEKCESLRSDPRFKPDFFIIEKKASGQTLLQELYRRGFPLIEYDPRGKKEERLQSAAVLMRTGRVWVPEGTPEAPRSWAKDVVEEVCNFPSAAHDDYADTVSQAVVYLRDMGIIRNDAYDYAEDEDDEGFGYQPKTYWNSL